MKNSDLINLHPEAKEISFAHKFFIQFTFEKSILGTLGIHYFSLMIIDSTNTLSIYSSEPALEYNMIHDGLWQHDGIFKCENHKDGAFIFWDELYSDSQKQILIENKERKFDFSFGFYIMRKMKNCFAIYSFATKSPSERKTFLDSKDILLSIGDYLFYELEKVHLTYTVPKSTSNLSGQKNTILKLVVNNIKKRYLWTTE